MKKIISFQNISINNNKKRKNKISISINNSKCEKNKNNLFYINFIIMIQILLKINNSSKIELTISGPGISKIFYDKGLTSFTDNNFPTKVYINDYEEDIVYSEYNFKIQKIM